MNTQIDALRIGSIQDINALPAALVEDGRVIEEWLDQVEFLAEEPAEIVHRGEHAPEEPEAAAHLPRREPGADRPLLLGEVAGERPVERVLAVGITVDRVPGRRRIVDLDERQLRHRGRPHLHVE